MPNYSYRDSCDLAILVFRRFGRDLREAADRWRRLVGQECEDRDFAQLVWDGYRHATMDQLPVDLIQLVVRR
jgi:hypothetical protein